LPEQAGVFYFLDSKHADDAAFPGVHLDVCRWLHGSYLLSMVAGLSTEAYLPRGARASHERRRRGR